jgi:tetratricopeptide (TPR) repeat protein
MGLTNIAGALRDVGALREAAGAGRQAVALIRGPARRFEEGVALQELALVCATSRLALGRVALLRSHRLFVKLVEAQSEGVVAAYAAMDRLWRGDFVDARTCAERAWELAAHHRNERDFIRAALVQGRAALSLHDLARAEERLHHALTRARAVNVVELELPALIALAELELQRRRPAEAKARLDEVWEAAERGPYPLLQADAYNVLAEIAIAEGDGPAAIDAATKAYRAAWCDGPPYAYHWGLEKVKGQLAALGAALPEMPAFDESKYEPMPDIDINPKDEFWVDPDKLG